MIECKYCKSEIDAECKRCPECGADLRKGEKFLLGCFLWLMLTLLLFVFSM